MDQSSTSGVVVKPKKKGYEEVTLDMETSRKREEWKAYVK